MYDYMVTVAWILVDHTESQVSTRVAYSSTNLEWQLLEIQVCKWTVNSSLTFRSEPFVTKGRRSAPFRTVLGCHLGRKVRKGHRVLWKIKIYYLIWMTHDVALTMLSSGWQNVILTLSHSDDLVPGRISSGLLLAHVVCHPDDLRSYSKSSGWHDEIWVRHLDYLLDVISHRDKLRHIHYVTRVTYAPTLNSSGWDTRFRFFTTRSGPSVLP